MKVREYYFTREGRYLRTLNVNGCISITTNPDKAQLFVRKRAKELYAKELKRRGWHPVLYKLQGESKMSNPPSEVYKALFNIPSGLTEGQQRILDAIPPIGPGGTAYQDFATAEQHWLAANLRNGVTAGEYAAAMRKIIDDAYWQGYEKGSDEGRSESLEGGV